MPLDQFKLKKDIIRTKVDANKLRLAGEAMYYFTWIYKSAERFLDELNAHRLASDVVDYIENNAEVRGFGSIEEAKMCARKLMTEAMSRYNYYKHKRDVAIFG